jgi:4-oxalocrotonate tautomerase
MNILYTTEAVVEGGRAGTAGPPTAGSLSSWIITIIHKGVKDNVLVNERSREGNTMPLARVDLVQGKSVEYRRTIGEVIYNAVVEILKAPKDDRFQVITEHPAEGFVFDPSFLGIERSKDCVFIQVTLNVGRTVEQKRAFYKAVADELHQRLNLRRQDVFIGLVEVNKENWSFGNGEAQLASR